MRLAVQPLVQLCRFALMHVKVLDTGLAGHLRFKLPELSCIRQTCRATQLSTRPGDSKSEQVPQGLGQ